MSARGARVVAILSIDQKQITLLGWLYVYYSLSLKLEMDFVGFGEHERLKGMLSLRCNTCFIAASGN